MASQVSIGSPLVSGPMVNTAKDRHRECAGGLGCGRVAADPAPQATAWSGPVIVSLGEGRDEQVAGAEPDNEPHGQR